MTLQLAVRITTDASGVRPGANAAKEELHEVGVEAANAGRAVAIGLDEAARAARQAAGATASSLRIVGGATDQQAIARGLDEIRAKYEPLFAAALRHRDALAAIGKAESDGAISASVAMQARQRATRALDDQTSAIERLGLAQKRVVEGAVASVTITPNRGADVAAYGQALDDLRARYNPLFAAERAHREQLDGIAQAQRVGAISAEEAAAAISTQQAAYTRQVGAINASRGAIVQHTGAARLSTFQLQQLTFQGNDVATMWLAGASAGQIFATQTGQVVQVLQMSEGGLRGSAAAIGSWLASVGRSALALATPLNIAIAGMVGLGVGVAAYALASRNSLPSVDEALKTHDALIARIRDRYGEAAVAASRLKRESRASDIADTVSSAGDLQGNLMRQAEWLLNRIVDVNAVSAGAPEGTVYEEFKRYQAIVDQFRASVAAGEPDFHRLREAIAGSVAAEPAASEARRYGNELRALAKDGDDVQGALAEAKGTVSALGSEAFSSAGKIAAFSKSLSELAGLAKPTETAFERIDRLTGEAIRNSPGIGGILAAQAARAAALQKAADDTVPLPRAKPNLADTDPDPVGTAFAQRQKLAELDARAAGARDAVTMANIAAERERLTVLADTADAQRADAAATLVRVSALRSLLAETSVQTQNMRDDVAARDKWLDQVAAGNITLAEAEQRIQAENQLRPLTLAMLNSEGYARAFLRKQIEAQNEAYAAQAAAQRRSAALQDIAGQNDQIEKLRLELSLIGQTTAARARALALLEADQKIRARGIDGTAEADRLRAQALAIAAGTTELERQQAAWQSWRDEAGGAIDGVVGDLATGKLGMDSLTSAAENAAKWFAQLAIANPLKNSLLGENNPTIGDVWDRITGKKSGAADGLAGAIASSVATMNVSAATVVVTGGAGGLLGGLSGANDNLGLGARAGGIGSDHVAAAIGANDNINISAAARAIRAMESSGNYSALGPVLDSGDRAYGAYGVMGANVPSWTKQWLGRAMSPAEFLRDRSAQDAVFQGQFGRYAGRYGTTGAAQAWLGGPGSVGKLDRADINGTTVGAYGERFDGLYKQFSGAGNAVDGLSKSATAAASSASRVGSGFDQVAQSAQSAAGGLSRIIQSIPGFGGLGAVLGGGYTTATGWLYDRGGYTGHGDVHQPAGVVHRGEVVWSQADVRRAGGVDVVEAMRLGRRGYANGGAVEQRVLPFVPLAAAASPAQAPGNQGGGFDRVTINNNGQPIGAAKHSERVGQDGSRELIIELGEAVASEMDRDGSAPNRAMNRRRMTVR